MTAAVAQAQPVSYDQVMQGCKALKDSGDSESARSCAVKAQEVRNQQKQTPAPPKTKAPEAGNASEDIHRQAQAARAQCESAYKRANSVCDDSGAISSLRKSQEDADHNDRGGVGASEISERAYGDASQAYASLGSRCSHSADSCEDECEKLARQLQSACGPGCADPDVQAVSQIQGHCHAMHEKSDKHRQAAIDMWRKKRESKDIRDRIGDGSTPPTKGSDMEPSSVADAINSAATGSSTPGHPGNKDGAGTTPKDSKTADQKHFRGGKDGEAKAEASFDKILQSMTAQTAAKTPDVAAPPVVEAGMTAQSMAKSTGGTGSSGGADSAISASHSAALATWGQPSSTAGKREVTPNGATGGGDFRTPTSTHAVASAPTGAAGGGQVDRFDSMSGGQAELDGPKKEQAYKNTLPKLDTSVDSSGGGGGSASSDDGHKMNLADYLPNGSHYHNAYMPAGMDPDHPPLQPRSVDIWGQISKHFRQRCAKGLLVDCANHLPR
jgi:hypothetical protein